VGTITSVRRFIMTNATQTVVVQSAASKILEVGDEIVRDRYHGHYQYILKSNGSVLKCMEEDSETAICLTWLKQGTTIGAYNQEIVEGKKREATVGDWDVGIFVVVVIVIMGLGMLMGHKE
jgi:hypothetical protein